MLPLGLKTVFFPLSLRRLRASAVLGDVDPLLRRPKSPKLRATATRGLLDPLMKSITNKKRDSKCHI